MPLDDGTSETTRQRLDAWVWESFAWALNQEYVSQKRYGYQGVRKQDLERVWRKADWTKYRYERGVWMLSDAGRAELHQYHSSGAHGDEPGPRRPTHDEPSGTELPVVVFDGRRNIDEAITVYLTACRMVAGRPVVDVWAAKAREHYRWCRGVEVEEVAA